MKQTPKEIAEALCLRRGWFHCEDCRNMVISGVVAAITAERDAPLSTPEVCICAAVVAADGQIIRCHRHADGLEALRRRELSLNGGADSQGFITSRGRYVGRQEGRKLQEAAWMASAAPKGYMLDTLMSEDLY